MFSNRWMMLKVLGALGLIAVMGRLSAQKVRESYPILWECQARPDRFDGRTVLTNIASVAGYTERGFLFEERGSTIEVKTEARPPIHELVQIKGTFRKEGYLDPLIVRRYPHYPIKRALMYAVSFLAVGVGAIFFMRRFTCTVASGFFRSV